MGSTGSRHGFRRGPQRAPPAAGAPRERALGDPEVGPSGPSGPSEKRARAAAQAPRRTRSPPPRGTRREWNASCSVLPSVEPYRTTLRYIHSRMGRARSSPSPSPPRKSPTCSNHILLMKKQS